MSSQRPAFADTLVHCKEVAQPARHFTPSILSGGRRFWLGVLALLGAAQLAIAARPTELIDIITVGDTASETAHALVADSSEAYRGALEQPARKLLPGGAHPWEGGRLTFRMKVDPQATNYLTARFWGDEVNQNFLILFCEGKQVGYRHLGDIDVLALPDDEPRYNGRFYYATTPLPRTLTAGKTELQMELRSNGPIWGYGRNFEQYQKPMTTPSRGIYRLYTHTDGCFVPPVDEPQGTAPEETVRPAPGEEVLVKVKERVNGTLDGILKSKRPPNQMQAQLLAKAYAVQWTVAFKNPRAVEQVIAGADERYQAWKKDPAAVWKDPATWNPDWFGLGPVAEAVALLSEELAPALEEKIDSEKTRRAAWSEMFRSSRDWLRTHRRFITNQTMFVDTNIYRSHRGVVAIAPSNAWPEEQAKRYIYECAGLLPWLGNDTPTGSEKPMGDSYFQITEKGLSRELGYVGGYGEILGQMVDLYEITRLAEPEGDSKIKARIAKVQRARGFFRYPMQDDEGHRAMRLETGIGWRDSHFPGGVTYAQRSGTDETAIYAAAATLEPTAVGAVQQMFADNQFFSSVEKLLADRRLRTVFGLLTIPDDYEKIKAQPPSSHRLPMSWDQPDIAFADEENGVVAIKHGPEILYVSLYWRAHTGINGLARVHYLTPRCQQVAVVQEDVKFEPGSNTYKRLDWVNFGFGNGGPRYPADLHSAHTGEILPVPKLPPGVEFKSGQNNPYAGRADFYQLRYGPYLIGMNTSKEKTFDLSLPSGRQSAPDLVSGKALPLDRPLQVGPRSTVILHLGDPDDGE